MSRLVHLTTLACLTDVAAASINGSWRIALSRGNGPDQPKEHSPFLDHDRFAVRFAFDQTHRATTVKVSLYTVIEGAITREEVYYDAPLHVGPASGGG
jgi:hypothetical protein